MKANTGKIIRVDLNAGAVSIEMLPENNYREYVGGSGLAAKYFWEKGDFNADALSPEAMLIFMNGPFSGLKLSGASRNSVAGRSPLTGHWADSSCGGFFAPELRYAGYDGIVITGKSPEPSVLLIEDDKIAIVDGTEYWGKGIEEVNKEIEEEIRQELPHGRHRPGRGEPREICGHPERRTPRLRAYRIRRRDGLKKPQGHRGQGGEKGDGSCRSGEI